MKSGESESKTGNDMATGGDFDLREDNHKNLNKSSKCFHCTNGFIIRE